MSGLEGFLNRNSGTSSSDAAPAATDGKPAETPVTPEQPAAPAPSAGKATETPAQAVTPVVEEPAARARDDKTGQFKKQEPVSDEVLGLRAALRAERAKNRGDGKPATPAKPTSFYDDADRAGAELRQEVRGELAQQRYNLSETAARQRHADFGEVTAALLEECQNDDVMGQHVFDYVNAQTDPAEAFYQYAQRHGILKQHGGDLKKYGESLTTPLQAKLDETTAKLAAAEEKLKQLGSIPASLATTTNNPPTGAAAPGKQSLGSIVGTRNQRERKRA